MAKSEPNLNVNSISRISAGTIIKGEITSPYDIRIDGTFEGKVQTKGRVVVGEKANVQGDIICGNIDLWGKVEGNVFVKDTLALKEGCVVNGNLNIRKLSVELGATFNGNCKTITEAEFDKLAKEGFALACGKEDATFADYKKSAHFRTQDLRFPSPALSDGSLDFSFSGLKTAAVNLMHRFDQKGEQIERERFAAAYTYEAVEAVAAHVKAALQAYEGYPLVVAGGVAANSHLRKRLSEVTASLKRDLFIPPLSLCGDNAAMVGAQAFYEFKNGNIASLDLNAFATMPIDE